MKERIIIIFMIACQCGLIVFSVEQANSESLSNILKNFWAALVIFNVIFIGLNIRNLIRL